jgi:hypothetical protein
MSFVVEYKMTRNDTSVEFPVTPESDREKFESLKSQYNIEIESIISDDGLIKTIKHIAINAEEYSEFYNEILPVFDKAKFVDNCGKSDIQLLMDIVENE